MCVHLLRVKYRAFLCVTNHFKVLTVSLSRDIVVAIQCNLDSVISIVGCPTLTNSWSCTHVHFSLSHHSIGMNKCLGLIVLWGGCACHLFAAFEHYSDVITSLRASQITCITIVYWTVYSGVLQRKHQSSTSLAFVRGIHRSPVNIPHKGPVTRKMFPFDDVIVIQFVLW